MSLVEEQRALAALAQPRSRQNTAAQQQQGWQPPAVPGSGGAEGGAGPGAVLAASPGEPAEEPLQAHEVHEEEGGPPGAQGGLGYLEFVERAAAILGGAPLPSCPAASCPAFCLSQPVPGPACGPPSSRSAA